MSKNALTPTGNTKGRQPAPAGNGSDALPAFVAERGYDAASWNTLKNVLFRGASDEAMLMVLDYCKARKLDPLKRPVHIVKVYDATAKTKVETVWQGINELRTTAQRTGNYAGMDEPVIGPMKTAKIGNETVEFPEYAQVTVYRMMQGHRVPFAGPRVYWMETYAQVSGYDVTPNRMWLRRPCGQLVKCAEAAALRAAFPEEIGHELSAEEMEGQIINDEPRHILQEAGHEPMTLDGEWDDALPEEVGGDDTPPPPPQPRQTPSKPPKAPTQPATNGARPGGSEAPLRPPVDWEEGDPLSIPDANGDVEVIYTDSRGTEHRLASSKALAKIEAAHKSTVSDAALDDLIRVNRAWLATHYAQALKAFETTPRSWAGE